MRSVLLMNAGKPECSAARSNAQNLLQPRVMTYLPDSFEPSDGDVICGRGKKCYAHEGNERFRRRVNENLEAYSTAKTKSEKAKIISGIVDQVRQSSSSGGGFVKQDESGRWYEVGDFIAREKTAQLFRDALHEQYRSSSIAKRKRKQKENDKKKEKWKDIAPTVLFENSSRLECPSSRMYRSRKQPTIK